MCYKIKLWLVLSCVAMGLAINSDEDGIEARGKKKKLHLLIYIADIVIKKIFVLKLIYAFVLFVVIHKAGYFLAWFISYLKEKKHHHHDHHDYHDYHDHYGPHHEYGPPISYGTPHGQYGPYRRKQE